MDLTSTQVESIKRPMILIKRTLETVDTKNTEARPIHRTRWSLQTGFRIFADYAVRIIRLE